jgi:hypothetical protein
MESEFRSRRASRSCACRALRELRSSSRNACAWAWATARKSASGFPEPGEYELAFGDVPGHEPLANLRVNVSSTEDRTIELALVPKPCVRLQLVCDGKRVEVPLDFKVERVLPDHSLVPLEQERVRARQGSGEEQCVWFPEPGEYVLSFRWLRDYDPLPTLQLKIAAGEERIVELALVETR